MKTEQEFFKKIADKAAKDETFLDHFKSEPAKAIEDFITHNCSKEEKTKIARTCASSLSSDEGSRELNDSELETVSGGYFLDVLPPKVQEWVAKKVIEYLI